MKRVAGARGLPREPVRQKLASHSQRRALGVLGEPRVDALALNMALVQER